MFCCYVVSLLFSYSTIPWYFDCSASILSGGIKVRIPQELNVVAFWSSISVSWFFGLGIAMSLLFVLWKNALESRCRGLFVCISWCRGVLVPESRYCGFLVLESWCCGVLVLESKCHGIYASTASFSLSSWKQKIGKQKLLLKNILIVQIYANLSA